MGGVGGIVVDGAGFAGVGLEIEELAVAELRVADEFPAFVADGALDLDVGEENGVAEGRLRAGPERAHAFAEDAGGRGAAGEIAERGENIEEAGGGLDDLFWGMPGPPMMKGVRIEWSKTLCLPRRPWLPRARPLSAA